MDAKPCPFCGESSITVVDGATTRWRQVECGTCGARGPDICSGATPECGDENADTDAIAAWNERATASPAPTAGAP